MAGEELRATLRGQTALAAAAYATLGTPRRSSTGRHPAAVEAAARLRFQGVQEGSVVAVLGLPVLTDNAGALELGVDDLARAAFDRLSASFTAPDEEVDLGVARALAELAESLGIGERHEELVLDSPRLVDVLHLDVTGRTRMRMLADAPAAQRSDVLVGSLREADFDKHTARLQTASGEVVVVAFPAGLEDQIYDALRRPAQVEGIVTVDPMTSTAKRVEVRSISTPEMLPFDPEAFWQDTEVPRWPRPPH